MYLRGLISFGCYESLIYPQEFVQSVFKGNIRLNHIFKSYFHFTLEMDQIIPFHTNLEAWEKGREERNVQNRIAELETAFMVLVLGEIQNQGIYSLCPVQLQLKCENRYSCEIWFWIAESS